MDSFWVEWLKSPTFRLNVLGLVAWVMILTLMAITYFRLAQPGWRAIHEGPSKTTVMIFTLAAIVVGIVALLPFAGMVERIARQWAGGDFVVWVLVAVATVLSFLITLATTRLSFRFGSRHPYKEEKKNV